MQCPGQLHRGGQMKHLLKHGPQLQPYWCQRARKSSRLLSTEKDSQGCQSLLTCLSPRTHTHTHMSGRWVLPGILTLSFLPVCDFVVAT